MTAPMMTALIFDGPARDSSRTRVGRVPVPTPAVDEVLIRVTHAGINFKDVMMRRGDPGYVPAWPVVPGLEVAGEIVRRGDEVRHLAVGVPAEALTNAGGLADYVVARAALTTHVPEAIAPEIAAAVPGVWSTAWLLLHEVARARAGDTILVHSASGAVGAAIAALAAAIPETNLLGVVGSHRRLEAARIAGYSQVFVRDAQLADLVLSATADAGVDVVLDPQGTTWLDADLRMLAPNGRIVLFGNASGASLEAIATSRLFATNGAVGGFSIESLSTTAPALVRHAMDAVFALIGQGRIAPSITVSQGLSEAAPRQQQLADGTATGKHVVSVIA